MKKLAAPVLTLLLLTPLAARAQDGCIDSPENPTAVLSAIGCAAAAAVFWRRRFPRR